MFSGLPLTLERDSHSFGTKAIVNESIRMGGPGGYAHLRMRDRRALDRYGCPAVRRAGSRPCLASSAHEAALGAILGFNGLRIFREEDAGFRIHPQYGGLGLQGRSPRGGDSPGPPSTDAFAKERDVEENRERARAEKRGRTEERSPWQY